MVSFIARFSRDDRGATAIEYGLIAAILAAVLMAALTAFNSAASAKYAFLTTKITGA